MACSSIVHGVEPKEENLLKYIDEQNSVSEKIGNIGPAETKLGWKIRGLVFEDGSSLEDWNMIYQSPWHWQYDDHELSFEIFEYRGGYWKLYKYRRVPNGRAEYEYGYGGQACRVAEVQYKSTSRSPHSGMLKQANDSEWVRAEEVDESLHEILRA